MLWPFLTIVAVAAAAGLHGWWRARYQRSQAASREALQKLQQEHERARLQVQTQREALFDSMAEGLLLLDETGRIQLANRAFTQLFGVQAELRSRTIMEALRLHELTELVESLGTQRQVLGRELRITRPQERWLQVNGSAVVDDAGHRHGTVLVFHDLTRLKQLERTRQEFVANVSHELRTPLSLIKGYVETLLDGAGHHRSQYRAAEAAHRGFAHDLRIGIGRR
jgi:two-component system phosphate regulon sensor histidine kinase PhoR